MELSAWPDQCIACHDKQVWLLEDGVIYNTALHNLCRSFALPRTCSCSLADWPGSSTIYSNCHLVLHSYPPFSLLPSSSVLPCSLSIIPFSCLSSFRCQQFLVADPWSWLVWYSLDSSFCVGRCWTDCWSQVKYRRIHRSLLLFPLKQLQKDDRVYNFYYILIENGEITITNPQQILSWP